MLPGASQVNHYGQEARLENYGAICIFLFQLIPILHPDKMLAEEDDEVPLSQMQLRTAKQTKVMEVAGGNKTDLIMGATL